MKTDLLQKKRWNNSLQKSIAIHVLLLLLAFLIRPQINPEEKIEAQYAVTVSFEEITFKPAKSSNSNKSRSTAGAQRQRSESPRKLETPKPTTVKTPTPTPPKPTPKPPTPTPEPTIEEPTDPVVSETTVDESDIQAVEEPIEVEDPEPEYIPEEDTQPEIVDEPVVLNPDLPSLDDIIDDINDDPIEMEEEPVPEPVDTETGNGTTEASGSGSNRADPSLKDGDGTGKADSGDGRGKDDSGDDGDSGIGTGGYGEGAFDDSGNGIFGRGVIYEDPAMLRVATSKSGTITFKLCINRQGRVVHVEINEAQSTITNPTTLRAALESMQRYRYEPKPSAPREECGQFKVIVDNYRGFAPRGGY